MLITMNYTWFSPNDRQRLKRKQQKISRNALINNAGKCALENKIKWIDIKDEPIMVYTYFVIICLAGQLKKIKYTIGNFKILAMDKARHFSVIFDKKKIKKNLKPHVSRIWQTKLKIR